MFGAVVGACPVIAQRTVLEIDGVARVLDDSESVSAIYIYIYICVCVYSRFGVFLEWVSREIGLLRVKTYLDRVLVVATTEELVASLLFR